MLSIGDENADGAPATQTWELRHDEGASFQTTTSLDERLLNHAERLRKEAESASQDMERKRLRHLARLADAAAEMADFFELPRLTS